MSHLQAIGRSILPSIPWPWRRKQKPLAALIWAHFIAQPGFRDDIRQAMIDLNEGRAIPLSEIRREQ
jgi:hypothetical protein